MTHRYESGQPIPKNVIDALIATGKIGFLTKKLWHEFFGQGTFRWQEQQFQFLSEKGFFKKHRNPYARHVWVLTEKSIQFLKDLKSPRICPVPVTYLSHDTLVAKSMLELQKHRLIRDFHVERELKTYGLKDFLLSNKDNEQKYPDAVFRMIAFGGNRTVAIEYERERKSSSRYKNILWQYANLPNLSMVLFIYEDSGIRKAIESAMKYLGQNNLTDKMAFVRSDDWATSAPDASIDLTSQRIKLREICSRM